MKAKQKNPEGVTPAVVLINPKYDHNVSGALRTCSCYGVPQLFWTGDRVKFDPDLGERLPREERMKGYAAVEWCRHERPFDLFANASPICVEVRENSENLAFFEFPGNPVFVLGPEDGSVPQVVRRLCHRFVYVPTHHCLNLAVALGTVLYAWRAQRLTRGLEPSLPLSELLHERRGRFDDTDVLASQLWNGK